MVADDGHLSASASYARHGVGTFDDLLPRSPTRFVRSEAGGVAQRQGFTRVHALTIDRPLSMPGLHDHSGDDARMERSSAVPLTKA